MNIARNVPAASREIFDSPTRAPEFHEVFPRAHNSSYLQAPGTQTMERFADHVECLTYGNVAEEFRQRSIEECQDSLNCCDYSSVGPPPTMVYDRLATCAGGAAGTIVSKALITGGAPAKTAYVTGLASAGLCANGGFAGCAVTAATALALRSAYRLVLHNENPCTARDRAAYGTIGGVIRSYFRPSVIASSVYGAHCCAPFPTMDTAPHIITGAASAPTAVMSPATAAAGNATAGVTALTAETAFTSHAAVVGESIGNGVESCCESLGHMVSTGYEFGCMPGVAGGAAALATWTAARGLRYAGQAAYNAMRPSRERDIERAD